MLVQNSSEQSAKKRIYIHTNIVNKKLREKPAKNFFVKHTNSASKKC